MTLLTRESPISFQFVTQIPIACTLTAAEQANRGGEWRQFLIDNVVEVVGIASHQPEQSPQHRKVVAFAVGAYITGAYWFTSSTSFANPAVTLARATSDTFAGIRPVDVPGFIIAQILGAAAATALFRWLVPSLPAAADRVVDRAPTEEVP